MNTTTQLGNHFQPAHDPVALVMNFDLGWLDNQMTFKPACGNGQVANLFPRPAKASVAPIDITLGQIDILWKLDRKTLERMATDPCTPSIVLERLANHPMAEIRAAVADNENTPIHLLWELSEDRDDDVRYQLAENHRLPLDLIESLTSDENPYVACRAQKTYDRLKAAKATSKFDLLTALISGVGDSSWKTSVQGSFL